MDIIVRGSTKEHDRRLQEVLKTTRGANLKLIREKGMLDVTELTFIGDIISIRGMKPDKAKIKAIEIMTHSQLKKRCNCFLAW